MGIASKRKQRDRERSNREEQLKSPFQGGQYHGVDIPLFNGVGDAVSFVIKVLDKAQPCGKCLKTAEEMNQKTPGQILDNIDHWADRMHQNMKEYPKRFKRFLEKAAYTFSGLYLHKRRIREGVRLYREQMRR